MGLFKCPYCERKIASIVSLANAAFVYDRNKKCLYCLGRIKLNISTFLLIQALEILIGIVVLFIGYRYLGDKGEEEIAIEFYLLIICMGIINYLLIYLIEKYCSSIRLFIPKDNVEKYMKKIKNYTK